MRRARAGARTVVEFRTAHQIARHAPRIAAHLRTGGLMAYPTETVYGLGSAIMDGPVDRLMRLKARSGRKPLLMLVADPAQLAGLRWTQAARRLANAFWPGPLTLVLHAEAARLPPGLVAEDGGVAIRASPHEGARAIIGALGGPITSTSANPPGRPPATSAEEAAEVLDELDAPPDLWLLDGGTLPPSPPSTVVHCGGERPRVLRSGAVSTEELTTVIGEIDVAE